MSKKNPDHSEEDYFEQMMDLQGVKSLEDDTFPQQKGGSDQGTLEEKFAGKPVSAQPRTVNKQKISRDIQPDDSLDLHGSTREEAIHKVQNFILTSSRYGFRVVLIITGKGLNSGEEGPVVRNSVWSWLKNNRGRSIHQFQEAPAHLGGSGAILIFLKQ